MFILKTADTTTNSQVFRPKASFVRPLSQQRPTSFNHFSPNPHRITQKSPIPRELIQTAPQAEYYMQGRPIAREKVKPAVTSAKIIHNHPYGSDSLESLKSSLQAMLQKSVQRFSEELARQNQQIKKLQKKIQYQNQEIQTKNHIIKTLISKIQRGSDVCVRGSTMEARKIEDLDRKLQIMIQQMEEEREFIQQKIENVTQRIISHLGGKLNAAKFALSHYLVRNSKRIEDLNAGVTAITQRQHKKLLLLQEELESLHNSIKFIEEGQTAKQNCSQINTSKDTASHNSSMSSNKGKREELFFSDYFFHPAEADNPSIKAIEELAKQRANQLPIRVYADGLGRLKYFESRTFIFDRKGNYTTPSNADILQLEQRGWIKMATQ